MRTTLTLEPDVAARLEKLREERESSFKDLVNDLLRRGLEAAERGPETREPYRIDPHDAGRCRLPSLDSLHHTLSFAEGEGYR